MFNRLLIQEVQHTIFDHGFFRVYRMLLFHRLPMEIADFLLCRVAGKQLPLRKLYARMTAGLDALSFFFHQDWDFMTSNAMEMQESLGDTDRYVSRPLFLLPVPCRAAELVKHFGFFPKYSRYINLIS